MDTVTQGLLGAVCGQVVAGRVLGRRALLWGAVAGVLPDLDVLLPGAHGTLEEFRNHRSLTHALWFGPAVGALLGEAAWRLTRRRGEAAGEGGDGGGAARRTWVLLFVSALFTHPLLDAFTSYGTQLLVPFSRWRVALDAVPIVDPFYSLLLAAGLAVGWRRPARAPAAGIAALVLSTAYLGYGVWLNQRALSVARAQLAREGVVVTDLHAHPTLLQPFLRRVVAFSPGAARVGMLSLLRAERPIAWHVEPQPRDPRVDLVLATPEGRLFEWFASGEVAWRVTPHETGTRVEIEDLRFGLGNRPEDGIWGLRADLDRSGALLGPPARFDRRPRGRVREVLQAMLQELY